ncbi:NHL repeat-containing protein [candidate division KSB1 bacterium]
MSSSKRDNDRLLTGSIILISVLGILYFGYQAVTNSFDDEGENPFEYNIENFKTIDEDLLHYSELNPVHLSFERVSAITVGIDENLFVAGDKSVQKITADGSIIPFISTSGTVYCLAQDQNSDLYLGTNDHIEVYDQNGKKKTQWESLGEEAMITSIAVSDEYVFTADAGNQIVWKYDKNGNMLHRIGDEDETRDIPGFIIPSPFFDVAIDPEGFLWIVNTGLHSLESYNMDGSLRSSWGESSMEIEGFCGCCNPTHIAILNDGKFVTSEKGIARVKVYNNMYKIESVVAVPNQFTEGTEGLDLAVDSSGRIYVLDPLRKTIRIFEKTKL